MKKLAGCLTIALVAVLVPSASGARSDACDTITVRSWNVKVDVKGKSYRLGETAKVDLMVTRKKTGDPVSDALAAVMVIGKKDHVSIGQSQTDAVGMATVSVKLLRKLRTGVVKLWAFAYRRQVDVASCATIAEYGYKKVPSAFRTKP